jgi:hypothetical protein
MNRLSPCMHLRATHSREEGGRGWESRGALERRKNDAYPTESRRGREGGLRAPSRQRAPPACEERRTRGGRGGRIRSTASEAATPRHGSCSPEAAPSPTAVRANRGGSGARGGRAAGARARRGAAVGISARRREELQLVVELGRPGESATAATPARIGEGAEARWPAPLALRLPSPPRGARRCACSSRGFCLVGMVRC